MDAPNGIAGAAPLEDTEPGRAAGFWQWLLPGLAADGAPDAGEIRSQQMAYFVRFTPVNAAVNVTISLIAVVALWDHAPPEWLMVWAGLIWAAALWNLYRWLRQRHRTFPSRIGRRGPRKATYSALVAGVLWGGSVVFFANAPELHRMMLLVMTASMAVGATAALGAIPQAAILFIASSVVPWLTAFLLQREHDYMALAAMAAVFMVGMMVAIRMVYASFVDGVRTRQKNAELLARFRSERDEWFEMSDSSEAFALFDSEGRLLLWNESYRRVLSLPEDILFRGARRADILRRAAPPLSVRDGEQTLDAWIGKQIALEENPESPLVEQLSNGRWVRSSAQKTQLSHHATTHVDVTELKEGERALRANEALLKSILDNSPVEIGLKDLEGRYVFMSRQFEKNYGVTNEKMRGKTAFDLFPPEVARALEAHDREVISSGTVQEHEMRGALTGAENTFLAVKFPVRDAEGAVLGVGAIATDITERKRAEEELERGRALLADAVEALADGFVIFDDQERLVLCNSKYRETYSEIAESLTPGITREEVARGVAQHCVGLEDPDEVEEWVKARLQKLRGSFGSVVQQFKGGRWVRVKDTRLANGWIVGTRTDITDLMDRETALLESEARLKAFFDNSPIEMAIKDRAGRYVLVNRRFEELYGVTQEDLKDKASGDIFPDAVAARLQSHDESVVHRGQVVEREEVVPVGEGDRTFLAVKFPLFSATGELSSIGAVAVDITERTRTEEALRESERRFQDYAEASADWFWEMDADLRFTYMSANVERIVGVPPEWHYGKTREELLGEAFDRELWAEHLSALRARKPFRDFVFPRVGEGIEQRWLRSSGIPLFSEDGKFLGYRGSGSDVTEAVHGRKALEASEAQLRLVTDSLPVMIAYVDSDERYLFVNKTCTDWYARPPEQIIGGDIKELLDKRYEDYRPHIEAVLRGQKTTFERTVVYPDGQKRSVQLLYVPSFGDNGAVVGFFILGEDITERKRSQQALRERESRLYELQRQMEVVSRQSALGQLSSALAHELNQPLTAIMNYIQAGRRLLGAHQGSVPDKADDMFDKALEQSARAGDVIRRLRSLFERGENLPERLHLNQVIEDAAAIALVDAESLGIKSKLNLCADLPPLMIDRTQIQQVILNLVRNSVEAVQDAERREITIATRSCVPPDVVKVTVLDTGPGLPKDLKDHLFEAFVSGPGQGMGMGLSISQRIIKAHGGRLWAEPNPGGGTCFRFTLPVAASAASDDVE